MPQQAGPAPVALTLGACQAQRSILALFELLSPELCGYDRTDSLLVLQGSKWGSSSMAVRITPLLCKRLASLFPHPRQPSTASGKMKKQPAPPAENTRTQLVTRKFHLCEQVVLHRPSAHHLPDLALQVRGALRRTNMNVYGGSMEVQSSQGHPV